MTVSDHDFIDDLALLFNTIQDDQSLLYDLNVAAVKVELSMNASKTEFMTFNIDPDETSISWLIMEILLSMCMTLNTLDPKL